MTDQDTFLTTLYVMIDDFCQSEGLHEKHRPGPPASLSCSEMVTLAVFGQWAQFKSECAFCRYALCQLRPSFPILPEGEQFNRLQRQYRDAIVAFGLFLGQQMQAQRCLYEALDSSGIPTRDAKRHGTGWLAGQADIGWSNCLGWYESFYLLASITPTGVITGFGFAASSCNDPRLAETFFAARQQPSPRLPSVGAPVQGVYVADKGFAGDQVHLPSPSTKHSTLVQVLATLAGGLRQIIETIYVKLLNTFRLACERPYALDGFQVQLAANVALHNFCIWLNLQLGREPLAFADLLDW